MSLMARRTAAADLLDGIADALLVTKLVNVRYLTGFSGSNGAALLGSDGTVRLATDGRYELAARDESADADLVITRQPAAELVALARRDGVARLAIERHHVTLALHDRLLEAAAGLDLVDGGEVIETLRMVKDGAELETLRRACAITDESFLAALGTLRPGVTEREVAATLFTEMRRRGADDVAFESIVAFGPHSARPHHRPTDRQLQQGDFVKMDFGAKVAGYHADLTRTVVMGSPATWQQELHDLVRSVQSSCVQDLVSGALPAALDAAAKERILAGGQTMPHGLGHGVGLEIHEAPLMVPESSAPPLVTGVALTVEPGAYLDGRGGVRIEDTVALTDNGVESLTDCPRELLSL